MSLTSACPVFVDLHTQAATRRSHEGPESLAKREGDVQPASQGSPSTPTEEATETKRTGCASTSIAGKSAASWQRKASAGNNDDFTIGILMLLSLVCEADGTSTIVQHKISYATSHRSFHAMY